MRSRTYPGGNARRGCALRMAAVLGAALTVGAAPALGSTPPRGVPALGIPALGAPPLSASLPTDATTTTATVKPSFAPNKLGAPSALTVAIGYSGPAGNVPAAVRRAVVELPDGLGIFPPSRSRSCSRATLQARGPQGCPAFAKVGSGSALLGAHLGTLNLHEGAALTAWEGPPQGSNPTLEIAGQGLSPLEERVVVTGVLLPDNPPYGEKLVMSIPPVPTLPTEPYASVLRLALTLGSPRAVNNGGAKLIRVPSRCPAGGFPFAASFTYADGSSGTASARVPCP
jgi:hypothetical protein